jgi:hypothetical protein
MKPHYLLLTLIFVAGWFTHLSFAESLPNLKQLYDQWQYFDLRDSLALRTTDNQKELLFFRGAILNKFFKPDSSAIYLGEFVESDTVDSTLLTEAYSLLADDYLKSFDYSAMLSAYATLIDRYGGFVDADKLDDYRNMRKIASALASVGPQEIIVEDSFRLQLSRDGMPLSINGHPAELAFDTGANLSGLIRSLAEQMNLRMVGDDIEVETISGLKVSAELAIADSLRIGKARFTNVVFLVMNDSDLYIPQAHYQIRGVIGFPVISSLGEVTFYGEQAISVPLQPNECSHANLCLDELTPLISGYYKNRRMVFSFDTGANKTFLYPPFYKAFADDLEPLCKPDSEAVIGVGGTRKIPTCVVDSLRLVLAAKTLLFKRLTIFKQHTMESSKYLYGNIGRDAAQNFNSTTINFESMCVWFDSERHDSR